MRISVGVTAWLGFLVAIPGVSAAAGNHSVERNSSKVGAISLQVGVDAGSAKCLELRPVRVASVTPWTASDGVIDYLDQLTNRRRKDRERARRKAVRRERRKQISRDRRHRRGVVRAPVGRHRRGVVRGPVGRHRGPGHRVRHSTCPGGYYWSAIQRRCIKSCPPGSFFSYVTGRCRRRGRHWRQCPSGTYWSHTRRNCISYRSCPIGHFWSYSLGRCQRLTTNCSYGWRYSPYSRTCVRRCPAGWSWDGANCNKPASACAAGWHWSAYYNGCVRTRGCPSGTSWDGYRCVAWRRCQAGYYWSSHFKSCRPKVTSCPYGYRYRPGWGCVLRCGSGWHWAGNRCVRDARACPAGTFYSAWRKRCISNCGAGLRWSYRKRRCVRRSW